MFFDSFNNLSVSVDKLLEATADRRVLSLRDAPSKTSGRDLPFGFSGVICGKQEPERKT